MGRSAQSLKAKKGRRRVLTEKDKVTPLHQATGWLFHRLGRARVFPERGRPGWLRIAIDVRPYGYDGQERVLAYGIQLVLAGDECVTLRNVECVHSSGFPLEIVARPDKDIAPDAQNRRLPVTGIRVTYKGRTLRLNVRHDGP